MKMKTPHSKLITQTELNISYVLRYGVLISGFIILLGFIIYQIKEDHLKSYSSQVYHDLLQGKIIPDKVPHTFNAFFSGILGLEADVIMSLGLIILVLLPVVRVFLTLFLFIRQRDIPYIFITSFVSLILISSLLFGKTF
jgi:uncharacterized membrane protein